MTLEGKNVPSTLVLKLQCYSVAYYSLEFTNSVTLIAAIVMENYYNVLQS